MINIFVYGTLKRGFYNNDLLKSSLFIADAITKEKYPMVNVESFFPYLINDKGHGTHVKGELFKTDVKTLENIDELEGYPDLYTREFITIISLGIEISAIVYFVKDVINYSNLELLEEFS